MRFTFILVCLLCALNAVGQKKKILDKVEADLQKEYEQWTSGIAVLKNDEQTELRGQIQFNEKTQVLIIRAKDESEILTANRIARFEFFDEEVQIQRNFISIDYPVIEDFKKDGKFPYYSLNEDYALKKTPMFFEVIRETKKFALLCRTSPLQSVLRTNNYSSIGTKMPTKTTSIELAQQICLFFLDAKGRMFLFSRGTIVETKKSTKKIKTSFWADADYQVNSDINLGDKFLEMIMGNHFKKVKEYMDVNELKSNRNEDLVKIVDYYKKLTDLE